MHLVCPSCGAVNRVPSERLGQGPSCGKCKQALLPREPVPVDAARLAKAIEKSDIPLVVDFWAPWCGPCRSMAPEFARAAAALHGKALFLKLDTEAHPQAGQRHAVSSIPLLAMFRGGSEVDRLPGARPASAISGWVTSRL